MTFATHKYVIPLLAAAAVALPALLATPAQAQMQGGGDYGSAEYEAYLEQEAKDARQSSSRKQGSGRQSAGTGIVASPAPTSGRSTRGPRHFLYDVRRENEQHYRGK
jgi:hypothetical protein